ncbi:MAG: hypothetical protein Q4D14_02630 [Bacteroidales bacterium]|nr:hypothetical protein [Bacteroidales bacterium]
MNIWIDVCHTPQYNFYRKLIIDLASRGHEVYVTVLKRGRTPKIVEREIGDMPHIHVYAIGRHRMSKWSAIVEANGLRIFQLLWWALGKHIDIVFSNCFPAMAIGWLLRRPRYAFDDDPQVWDFRPKQWTAIESDYCLYEAPADMRTAKNVKVLPVLKEWAYLAPKYFHADVEALKEYGVKPKQYIFLREVTVGTFNYAEQQAGAVKGIYHNIEQMRNEARQHGIDMQVLFSLEEKHRRNEYPDDWTLLQEPIRDIHSLIYYAVGLISSGDSMAREAALLGVPSYYLGVRYDMPANQAASKVAQLQNQQTMPVTQWLTQLAKPADALEQQQETLRDSIDHAFIDINAYMMSLVEKHDKKRNQ